MCRWPKHVVWFSVWLIWLSLRHRMYGGHRGLPACDLQIKGMHSLFTVVMGQVVCEYWSNNSGFCAMRGLEYLQHGAVITFTSVWCVFILITNLAL